MKKLIYIISLFLFLLFGCNRKFATKEKEKDTGFSCYHEEYNPDITYLENYVDRFSKFLPSIKSNVNFEPVELFYASSCPECSDKDRVGIFVKFKSPEKIYLDKVNLNAEILKGGYLNVKPNFYDEIKSLTGKFIRRDCLVEGGASGVFYVKNSDDGSLLSYYKSVGFDGSYRDTSDKSLEFVNVLNYLLSLSATDRL